MFVCRYLDDRMDDFSWGFGETPQDAFEDMLFANDLTEEDLDGDPQFFEEIDAEKDTKTFWKKADEE